MNDKAFLNWFCEQVGFATIDDLHLFLEWATKNPKAFYKQSGSSSRISQDDRQFVYDYWKEHSVVSVDRRKKSYISYVEI